MKIFQSFESFCKALREEQVPNIDINKIKDVTIYMPTVKSNNSRRKLILVSLAVVLVMCFSTVAFASDTVAKILQSWKFVNNKEEVLFEYTEHGMTDEQAKKHQEKNKSYDEVAELIKPQLQKGEGAIIVTPEMRGFVEYEEYVEDIALLKQQSSVPFKIPTKLPADYSFVKGKLSYEWDDSKLQDSQTLTTQAEQSAEGYIVEKVSFTPKIREITLNYSNGDEKIEIHISPAGAINSYSRANYKTEVLKIGDKEVLHNWFVDKSSGTYFVLEELESQNWLYVITTTGSLTMDEVTNLINSIE